MTSITWSVPAMSGTIVTKDNRYWVTSQSVIKDTVTHTPKLIIPAVSEKRRVSIFFPLSLLVDVTIGIRAWINPLLNTGSVDLSADEVMGHLWFYGGQNIAELEISDAVWFATLEPSDTQVIVVKTATLALA